MAKKDSVKKWVDTHEKKLRAEGWMTVDEFMERITPAMKEYLVKNWTKDEDTIHHPEDLASNALSFMEAIFCGITTFGASPVDRGPI